MPHVTTTSTVSACISAITLDQQHAAGVLGAPVLIMTFYRSRLRLRAGASRRRA
jgi:hypothetical protein